jgi:hypothetical protein
MFSIVCVYNNKDVFSRYLLKSLKAQTAEFELVALDNSAGAFSSTAQALNHGARQIQASSKYIMFAHQDFSFCSPSSLEKTEKMLDALTDVGIAGVAGNNEDEKRIISNIQHGTPPRTSGKSILQPLRVMTLDECCVFIPRSVFNNYCFDETVCDGWHAYAVDYCLNVSSRGLGVYVLPVEAYHVSEGMLSFAYFKGLKKVLQKYHARHETIHTTCGSWNTGTPVSIHWLLYRFYSFTGKLLSSGLIPEWVQRKKRKRLGSCSQKPS